MIDIHNHILPDLDDGARSMEEAIEMARIAVSQGISGIIATPHHLNGRYTAPISVVNERIEALNHELTGNHIPLKIYGGQEIRIHDKFVQELHHGMLGSLCNSRYILIELPNHRIPEILSDVLQEIKVTGLRPIIAHPERNLEFITHPYKLVELIERGTLCQLTAHSVTGLFGKQLQKAALYFCKSKMIHFIASDAHNPYRRSFVLKEAYAIIHRLIGPQFKTYYEENASRVLRDEAILVEEPELRNRKAFFRR